MDGRRFFLLYEPCPSSEIPKMMGRVVANRLLPLQKFAPFRSGVEPHNPEDIILDILPKPSLSTNRKDILSATTDNGLKLALGSLFGVNFARSHEQQVELATKEVKTYALSNPDEFFDRLMENKAYAADVQKLFAGMKKRHAFFVTGFLATSGASWTWKKGQGRTDGFKATVPLSAISGVPLPGLIDPTVEPSHTVKGGLERTMDVEEEQIFAMSYSLVKITYHFGTSKQKPEIAIGPPKIANLSQLAMAYEDEEDEPAQADPAGPRGDVFLAEIEDEDEEDGEEDEDEADDEAEKKRYFTLDI